MDALRAYRETLPSLCHNTSEAQYTLSSVLRSLSYQLPYQQRPGALMYPSITEVSLRVLYTVNTSPQYILAKAPQKIPFIPVSSASTSTSLPRHGRVSVKDCALAICRSSPELRPDLSKDYSVYILDPLEDLMSKSRHGQSGGVAVGMGLLSNILSSNSNEVTMVTGTFVGCGHNEDALEVVISLKQIAPPMMSEAENPRLKPSAKRTKQDQSHATSSSLPIPSLSERILTSYASSPGSSRSSSEPSSSKTTRDRKVNPSHFTRAHLIPTPYIGPPKRKYTQRTTKSFDQSMEIDTDREASEGPSSSQTSSFSRATSIDMESHKQISHKQGLEVETSIELSTQSDQASLTQPPNLAETAIMLAALSSVSSNSHSTSTPSVARPELTDPNFISFLKVYLATLESQQQNSPQHAGPSDTLPAEVVSENLQTPTATSFSHLAPGISTNPADKENWKPPPPGKNGGENEKEQSTPQPLPLASSRVNTWNSSSNSLGTGKGTPSSTNSSASSSVAPTPSSSDSIRKRKLSSTAHSDQNSQERKRTASSSKQNTPQDLSGIRVNTGWGGLRVRSDGTLVGEHRPSVTNTIQTAPVPVPQPLFRSTTNSSINAPSRRGPYVVPEWAKGVPAPAPPKQSDVEQKEREQSKTKKKGKSKSKSLNRLGGKTTARDLIAAATVFTAPNTPPKVPTVSKSEEKQGRSGPSTPPKKTSPVRLPFLAQTSPAAKSNFAAFFQAFQTSPIRSASIQKDVPLTPRRTSATSPPSSAKFTSLFTPSPVTTSVEKRSRAKELFPDDDAPPSPSPTKKSLRPFSIEKSLTDRLKATQAHPESDLPVASSDDAIDINISKPDRTISSDSTIINSGKVHDWSSLDLPPSSPPPPTSPPLAPVEGSDLPCSDSFAIASDEDTPPAITEDSSTHTSPSTDEEVESPEPIQEGSVGNVADFNFIDDTNFTTFGDNPFADLNLEQGSAASMAFDTLQNLGAEVDLTEAWNLLSDMVQPVATNEGLSGLESDQWRAWINDNTFSLGEGGADLPNNELPVTGVDDFLTSTANQFNDLFRGSLI